MVHDILLACIYSWLRSRLVLANHIGVARMTAEMLGYPIL
jgi:hypothetical protein